MDQAVLSNTNTSSSNPQPPTSMVQTPAQKVGRALLALRSTDKGQARPTEGRKRSRTAPTLGSSPDRSPPKRRQISALDTSPGATGNREPESRAGPTGDRDADGAGAAENSPAPPRTRPQTSPTGPTAKDPIAGDPIADVPGGQEATRRKARGHAGAVEFWVQEQQWPAEYFEPSPMERLLARKRPPPSLGRKRLVAGSSAPSDTTPSDQRPREEKSAPYKSARYEILLQTKGSYMNASELDITDASKRLVQDLLTCEQAVPKETLFDESVFKEACRNLQNKNEARLIRDLSPLLVPSAETLALRSRDLKMLCDSVNEGWNNAIPLAGTRPQPDMSVGFRREAFAQDQLDKLAPFIGDWIFSDTGFLMATFYMYFPFLSCEVKCDNAALKIADRQNAHSMTLAARAVVELFRVVKRESELHRELLAFSVSHDNQAVRIHGCYPVIDGEDTKYYRHLVDTFDITAHDGRQRWTAYRFTKNVYEKWAPMHLKRICSAIDQLPSQMDLDAPQLSEAGL